MTAPLPSNPRDCESPAQVPVKPPPRPGINWFRFWVQMALAMLAFNIVAGLVTWYFIWPHLHPVR